jgi:hypothetical protein
MWRCLRCEGEFPLLLEAKSKAHHITVGQETIAWCCDGCVGSVKREIVLLVPEPSFHGSGPVD